jgi:hypothetical protein
MLLTKERGRLGHMQTMKLRHCAATRGLKIDGSRGVIYHNTSVCLTVAADLWLHSRHHEAVKTATRGAIYNAPISQTGSWVIN